MRPILTYADPRLQQVAEPVGDVTDELRELAEEMLRIMYAAQGRGLAGPQIGEMRRIFVMDCSWKEGTPDPRALLDPEITAASDELVTLEERCLSLPGMALGIARPAEVSLRFTDLDGTRRAESFTGFAARCVQHERDHLDGILCFDRLSPEVRQAIDPLLKQLAGA
jgi:peptide deformylase